MNDLDCSKCGVEYGDDVFTSDITQESINEMKKTGLVYLECRLCTHKFQVAISSLP